MSGLIKGKKGTLFNHSVHYSAIGRNTRRPGQLVRQLHHGQEQRNAGEKGLCQFYFYPKTELNLIIQIVYKVGFQSV